MASNMCPTQKLRKHVKSSYNLQKFTRKQYKADRNVSASLSSRPSPLQPGRREGNIYELHRAPFYLHDGSI